MPHWIIDSSNSIKDNTSGSGQGYAFGLGSNDSLYILSTGYILETAANSDAVHVNNTAFNCDIIVDGLISGTKYGIENFGINTSIEIGGKVVGGDTGIWDNGSAQIVVDAGGLVKGDSALHLGSGSSLVNAGTLISRYGIEVAGGLGQVTNAGLISSLGSAFTFNGDGAEYFKNAGTIQGGIDTILGTATSEIHIDNSGLWTGTIGLTPGNDVVTNTGRIDGKLYLEGGNNLLDSRFGIITGEVNGGSGIDSIRLGAEDNEIAPGAGADSVDGGGGVNTIDYGSSVGGVRVNLSTGIARGGDAQGDHLSNIQNVLGTLSNDVLVGDDSSNLLQGSLGQDQINGNGGNDTIIEYGTGTAVINGGAGNDLIRLQSLDAATYSYAFSSSSQVNGGAGIDTLDITNVPAAVVFGSSTVLNIEIIVLEDGFNYNFTSSNATVSAGQSLEVDAGALTGSHKTVFNGSAETDGAFLFEGGTGADTFIGGSGADTFFGGAGGDKLTGGLGADVFSYSEVTDSRFTGRDTISGLNADADKLQFDHKITSVGTTVSGSASTVTDIQSLVTGHLPANSAVLVNVTGGSLSGHLFLIVDNNAAANYQYSADFFIDVTGMTGTLSAVDFIV